MKSVTGCSTNVATTNAPNEKPTINIQPGKPSRYMTIKKAPYTSAKPVSFCATDKTAGSKAITPPTICEEVLLKSMSCRDIYFASASAENILHSSAGCRLKP